MHYHVSQGGVNVGKFSEADIQRKLANGSFSPNDHYWAVGMPGWKPLAGFRPSESPSIPSAASVRPATSPRPQPVQTAYTSQTMPGSAIGSMPIERIQTFGYIGGGLLALGTFGPVFEIGMISASLMQNGNTKGLVVLGCGIAGIIFSQIKMFGLTWIPATIASLILAQICFHFAEAPSGNFFGTRISISPGWGLFVMVIGAGFLIASAWNGTNRKKP